MNSCRDWFEDSLCAAQLINERGVEASRFEGGSCQPGKLGLPKVQRAYAHATQGVAQRS